MHARYAPFARLFSYDLVLIDIDIDRLDEARRQTGLFAVNGPGLFSFCTSDHGPKCRGAALRPWAEETFLQAGVDLDGGTIRLVTFPRHFFYKFAPLSLWYGYGPGGELRGIIYEVNNTFGESHAYVAALSDGPATHTAEKSFHVSPFLDISGTYRFRLRPPQEKLGLVIDNIVNGERVHMAAIKARALPATAANLSRLAITNPLSTIGVMVGIHWQALKIWWRKAGYRPKPSLPENPVTVAKQLPEPVLESEMEAA